MKQPLRLLLLTLFVANSVVPPHVNCVNAADWLTWRGEDRDGLSTESGLMKRWPADGPKKVWTSTEAGIGYSSFAVEGDRIYTLGADETKEYLIALDALSGKRLWASPIGERLQNGWGDGPRSTPTIAGDLIVALAGRGRLVCASKVDGAVRWSVEMTEIGGSKPNWGYSESPLVDGDRVFCTPGGNQGTVACFQLQSGKKIWQSKELNEKAHYSSIIAVDHFGQHQYIQLTMNKLFGLNEDGKLLWEAEWPLGRTAVVPTPIYHDHHVYVTSGYGAGCMLVKVSEDNVAEKVYENKVMKNHHGGVIRVGDHVYGYSDGVGWTCQNMMTGDRVWNDKKSLGKGAIAYADGMFYCLDEKTGTCVLIKAKPVRREETGRFTMTPQTEQRAEKGKIWTHPVIANGRLYLRDQEIVCCYDVKQ